MTYVYVNPHERLKAFEPVFEVLQDSQAMLVTEMQESYFELDKTIDIMTCADILCVSDMSSFGSRRFDICQRLERILAIPSMIAVLNIDATYTFGLSQPLNQAVLRAVLQGLQSGTGDNILFVRPRQGRPRADFPDNWADLYTAWESGEISSGEFLAQSGVRRATFYNLITEYRELKRENAAYLNKYGIA